MSTGGNKAQIDLIANPDTLKSGMDKGKESVEEFSKSVMDSMKDSSVSVEELEKHFKSLVDELSDVIDKNAESTKSTLETIDANRRSRDMLLGLLNVVKNNIVTIGILTATVIKSGGSMADKAAKIKTLVGAMATLTLTAANCTIGLGKLAGVMVPLGLATGKAASSITFKAGQIALLTARIMLANPVTVAYTAATLALGKGFEETGKTVTQKYGEPIARVSELIAKHHGQVHAIKAELAELGLELEDVGLKATSNWTILSDKTKEAAESTFHLNAIYEGIKAVGKVALTELSTATTVFFTNAQEHISYGLDGWNHYAKKANEAVGDMYLSMMGYDKAYIDNVRKVAKEAEEVQKKSKAAEIRKKQMAEDIALAKKWNEAWQAARREDEQQAKAASLTTVEAVEKEIEAHDELRKKLEKEGKLASEAGRQWKEYYDKLIAKQVELSKVTNEFGKSWFKVMSPERARELGILAEYTQLNVDATRAWKDAVKEYDESVIKTNREVLQAERERGAPREHLRDILEDEQEALDKLLLTEQEGTDKLIEQTRRVEDLKQRIRDKEREELEANEARKLRAIDLEIEKEKQLKGLREDVEDTKRHTEQEDTLHNLEKQGASLKAIHQLKMKFIDEEEEIAVERAKAQGATEVDLAKIHADAEKQRIREMADFKRKASEDIEKQNELQLQHGNEVALKNLQGVKDADAKIHKERMRQIDEEEERLLAKANTEAEKLNIKLNMEKERDKERADFKAKPAGMQMVKPKTRTELRADAKKARKAAEAQVRANKAATAQALFDKKQAMAKKVLDNKKVVMAKAEANKKKQQKMVSNDNDKGTPLLQRIAAAAEMTNRNENKLIDVVKNAGALS